ncbi:hypothetical protein TRAPUB_13957 [Trametes pubescens]|uniref:Uncharacterized protein n=1 Tax=Trametes pubescens TaxID=154538 RepID=A0A1M2VPU4_TRAPU|nr:hypothetical protein TRAPUB_13957 [Trametes pubescens]
MLGQKRPLSPESPRSSRTKTKRHSVAPPVDVDDDDEDTLEFILAQIKAQEQSEALAKKLQAEWDAPGPSIPSGAGACGSNSDLDDVIVISDDEEEDDEAIARRLAKQWELEDVVLDRTPESSSSKSSDSKGKANAHSATTTTPTPTSALEQYRVLFTGTRICSCGVALPSPRGHVSPQYSTAASSAV